MNYRTEPLNKAKEVAERDRVEQYGALPNNPFKQLRLAHQYTHKDLEERIYISKQALIRLEQGTYDQPLPSVLEWWAEHVCSATNCPTNENSHNPGRPIGELRLRDAYSDYQSQVREHYSHLFGPTLEFTNAELVGAIHPFRLLRARAMFNVTETAKALCVPQATIEHFEKKYRTQQSVPKNIRSALSQMGYRRQDLNVFGDAYDFFRQHNTVTLRVS